MLFSIFQNTILIITLNYPIMSSAETQLVRTSFSVKGTKTGSLVEQMYICCCGIQWNFHKSRSPTFLYSYYQIPYFEFQPQHFQKERNVHTLHSHKQRTGKWRVGQKITGCQAPTSRSCEDQCILAPHPSFKFKICLGRVGRRNHMDNG